MSHHLGWRYVASVATDPSGEDLWEVRELYEESDGTFGYTTDPIAAAGTTLGELRRDLTHMLDDLARPYLDLRTDPSRLVDPEAGSAH